MKTKALRFMAIIGIVASVLFFVANAGHAASYGNYTYTVSNGEVTITDFPTSVSGSVTVPSEINGYPVTRIGSSAFYGCSRLTDIIIPDCVTSIGDYVFYGCSSLESITLPFVGSSRESNDNYDAVFGYIFGYTNSSGNSGTTYQYTDYYNGKMYYYYIPTSLKCVTITDTTQIPENAFYNCSSLTEITIPDSVTSIGYDAFAYCQSLTDITIPDSVTRIGNYAFYGCSSLTGITIPDGVTSIGNYAFYSCSSINEITIPNGVTSIGSYAFSNTGYYNNTTNWEDDVLYIDSRLIEAKTSIEGKYTVKDGTKTIANSAFYSCSSLTEITIPDSVTNIGEDVFYGCSRLESITLPFVGLSRDSTYRFGEIFNNSIPSSLKHVTITDITQIHANAFSGCSSLTGITIPYSVTSIGASAFSNCSSLTDITIPSGVTSIGDGAFSGCSSLTEVTIPNSITSIGNSMFSNCSSLTDITIPYSVTSIGASAFSNCSSLTGITIPDSVTSIGYDAFLGCSSLTGITIPDSITNIEAGTFRYCSGLTGVTIPDSVTSIGDGAFSNCSSLTQITIPDSVNSIGIGAFEYCRSLTKIAIPDSITRIEEMVFSNCSSLTDITIPNSVTSIGYDAFAYCQSLTDITIPSSVTNIEDAVFYSCNSLESITLPFVGSSREETGNYMDVFGYIFGCVVGNGYSEATYQFDDGVNDYYYHIPSSLKHVTITDATKIPDSAFYNCSNIKSIIIPNSVTCIGDSAFYNCNGLTGITIPDSVTSIGSSAFSSCSFKNITIPKSVTVMGSSVFNGCNDLTVLNIPFIGESRGAKSSPKALFGYIFGGIEYGDSYPVNQVYNSLGESAKYYIPYSLTEVNITDATQIPYGAFYGCRMIESAVINKAVTVIGDRAFVKCDNLMDLYIRSKNIKLPRVDIFIDSNIITMHGIEGSVVEQYARENGIDFMYITDEESLPIITAEGFMSGNDIILHLLFEKEVADKVIIGAFYDNGERLVKVVTLPVKKAVDAVYFTADDMPEISSAKIMVRDSITSAEPETVAATVEIIR